MWSRTCRSLALLALCSLASAASPWTPQAYPNPTKDLQSCGRHGKPSWICDPDHILSEYSADVVEGTIKDILQARDPYRRSPCPNLPVEAPGYQVAVALVKSMKLQRGNDEAEQAAAFAKSIHQKWGVGASSCDNGLVLFLSKGDRQVFIAADEDVLSSQYQQYILDRIKPHLRKGDFDGGIEAAVVDLGIGLSGADLPDDTDSEGHWDWGLGVVGLIFGGVLCNWGWQGYKHRRESKHCRSLLQKLKDEQSIAVRNQQYPAASCPICFEDLARPGAPASVGSSGVGMADAYKQDQGDSSSVGASSSKSEATFAPSAPPLGGRPEHQALLGGDKENRDSEAGHYHDDKLKQEGKGANRKLKPLSLPCGHTFCEDCISRWLNDKNSCPVCRKPLTGDQPDTDPNLTQGSAAGGQEGALAQRGLDRDMYATEVMFRMGRLQRLYPYYVTGDMISDWGSNTRNGQSVSWDASRSLQVHDPEVRQRHHDWGQQGTSASFGGGGGYSGGGTGGSW